MTKKYDFVKLCRLLCGTDFSLEIIDPVTFPLVTDENIENMYVETGKRNGPIVFSYVRTGELEDSYVDIYYFDIENGCEFLRFVLQDKKVLSRV